MPIGCISGAAEQLLRAINVAIEPHSEAIMKGAVTCYSPTEVTSIEVASIEKIENIEECFLFSGKK